MKVFFHSKKYSCTVVFFEETAFNKITIYMNTQKFEIINKIVPGEEYAFKPVC